MREESIISSLIAVKNHAHADIAICIIETLWRTKAKCAEGSSLFLLTSNAVCDLPIL